VLGSQWGDEGKGKLVDQLCEGASVCARFNGGANAGHTLVVNGKRYAMHLTPCGILHSKTKNILCHGTVIHLQSLMKEVQMLSEEFPDALKRIFVSTRAHLLFDFHKEMDQTIEAQSAATGTAIGTTKQGIGPCYATKSSRSGIRAADLLSWESFETKYRELASTCKQRYPNISWDMEEELARHKEYAKILSSQIVDGIEFVHGALQSKAPILIEGANGAMLDIDLGTYPYVSSSNTTVGGICTGMGLPPKTVQFVIGVAKSYLTRVGNGLFPTEVSGEVGKHLLDRGQEYGTTTGRPRRCGWLDIAMLRYTNLVNGFDALNMTKLDVLTGLKELKLCVKYRSKATGKDVSPMKWPSSNIESEAVEPVYETLSGWVEDISSVTDFKQLPENAKRYVHRVEELMTIPICWVGVGPDRVNTLTRFPSKWPQHL